MQSESGSEERVAPKQGWNARWFWYSMVCVLC
jgi:hypothetical protein